MGSLLDPLCPLHRVSHQVNPAVCVSSLAGCRLSPTHTSTLSDKKLASFPGPVLLEVSKYWRHRREWDYWTRAWKKARLNIYFRLCVRNLSKQASKWFPTLRSSLLPPLLFFPAGCSSPWIERCKRRHRSLPTVSSRR